jgi:hypothetical protein
MSVPSYLYSPLDLNTIELTKELESLGGGDAKTKNIDVYIILNTPIESKGKTIKERNNESKQTLWTTNDTIGIRNINVSNATPMSESMKYYNITNTYKLYDIINNPDHSFPPIKEVSDWILDGFNACLISYGSRNIGKSLSLFGSYNQTADVNVDNLTDTLIHDISSSLIFSLFKLLFNAANSSNDDIITIGLSCWVLYGNNIYDLFLSTACDGLNNENKDTSNIKPLEFISIECPNINIAMQLLVLARIRAKKSIQINENDENNIDNSHFFTRIIIHKSNKNEFKKKKIGISSTNGVISHLHIVDLIGTSPIDTVEFNKLSENERIITRGIAFQLHSFNKILYQMKSLTKSSDIYDNFNSSTLNLNKNLHAIQPIMTSARDSKLSSILAPILQGNTRLFMMAYVRDGKKHYQETLTTLNLIDNLTSIISACYKVKNVTLSSLNLKQHINVLSPFQVTAAKQSTTNKISNNTNISLNNKENCVSTDSDKDFILSSYNKLNISNDNTKVQKVNNKSNNNYSFSTDIIQDNDIIIANETNENCLDKIVDQFHSLMESIEKQDLYSNNTYQHNNPNINTNIGTINNNSLGNINKYLFPNIIEENSDSIQDKMSLSIQTWYNNKEDIVEEDDEKEVKGEENITTRKNKLKTKKKLNSSKINSTNNSTNNTPLSRSLSNSPKNSPIRSPKRNSNKINTNSSINNKSLTSSKKKFFNSSSAIKDNLADFSSISIRDSIRNKINSSGRKIKNKIKHNINNNNNNSSSSSYSVSQFVVGEIVSDSYINDVISKDSSFNDVITKEQSNNNDVINKEQSNNNDAISKEQLNKNDVITKEQLNKNDAISKEQINLEWSKSSESGDYIHSSDLDFTSDGEKLIANMTLNSSLSDAKSSTDSYIPLSDTDDSIGDSDSYIRISGGSSPGESNASYSRSDVDSDLDTGFRSRSSINVDINNDRVSKVSNNMLSIDDNSNGINSSNDEITSSDELHHRNFSNLIQTQNSIISDILSKEASKNDNFSKDDQSNSDNFIKDDQFSSDNFSLNNYTNSINSYDYLARNDDINKDIYTDSSINRDNYIYASSVSDDHFISSGEKSNKDNNNKDNNNKDNNNNNNNNNNKDNKNLLLALENEKLKNVVLSNKMKELEFNLIEEITLKDIELDSLKVDILKYKSQLRELIDNASLTDVFVKFENDIERITIENQNLRERNLYLENKEYNNKINNKSNNNNNNNNNNIKCLLNKYDGGRLNRLQNKINASLQNNNILIKENDELKKKDRNSYLNHKITSDLTRRYLIIFDFYIFIYF